MPQASAAIDELTRILEAARGRPFQKLNQTIVLGWTSTEGTDEKGSVTALFSMLLKRIHIAWYMVIHKDKDFDYAKNLVRILGSGTATMEGNSKR